MLNPFTALLSLLVSVTAGTGCEKISSPAQYSPETIELSRSELILHAGEAEQLRATVVPAVAVQPNYQWSSSNNAVATVENGLVKALAPGNATITVSYKSAKKAIDIQVSAEPVEADHALLYSKWTNSSQSVPELITDGAGQFQADGFRVTNAGKIAKLDRFYAVAERKVQYIVQFSADAKAIFRSSQGDFNAYVDIVGKKISIATNPVTEKKVEFLQPNRSYLVEVYHIYQESKLRIVDMNSGESAEIKAVHDGQGGAGKGVLQPGFSVGMQWDHYCFGLSSGTSMVVKRITVYALKKKVKLLMYGDSITQPEGYFPTNDFSRAWTQQVIARLKGNAMSSGRGGANIDMVLDYIKNELPYIDAEYVMVTIGTNGGNTEAKLQQLVDYIRLQGGIPVLNNIPSNESGTQVAEAVLIEKVRAANNIRGAKFDLATSLAGDGREVDKTTMYWEDYSGSYGWQIYHHPNEVGGDRMFQRTLTDLPEIYR